MPKGAFAGRSGEQSYFVVCDERINTDETHARRQDQSRIRLRGHASRANTTRSSSRTSRAARARRSISVNRFANYSPSVDLEIESSILRGLVPLAPVVPPLGPVNESTGTVAPVDSAPEAPLAPYLEA